jgi:hypothetical protein
VLPELLTVTDFGEPIDAEIAPSAATYCAAAM